MDPDEGEQDKRKRRKTVKTMNNTIYEPTDISNEDRDDKRTNKSRLSAAKKAEAERQEAERKRLAAEEEERQSSAVMLPLGTKRGGPVARANVASTKKGKETKGKATPALLSPPSVPVPVQSGVIGGPKKGCIAFQNFGIEQLIPYEQSSQLLHDTSGTRDILGTRDTLEILNRCSNILTRQVFLSSQLSSRSADTIITQEDLSCINPDETIRAQGLFDMGNLPSLENIATLPADQLSGYNMLTAGDVHQKFAIPSYEGNPNGVLAVALAEAVSYLHNNMNQPGKKQFSKKEINDKTIRYSNWLVQINSIFGASRKQGKSEDNSSSYTEIANNILTEFNEAIGTISDRDTDKFLWIFKVYGPFLNKGLSDISQAGELSKFYVLKYIQQKIARRVPVIPVQTNYPGERFWITTGGLPSLSAYSSDTIASALGVRIQNLFKGQFQSICPRKHEGGNFMVVYIPYNYMSLMYLISFDELTSIPAASFSTDIRDKIQKTNLFDNLKLIKTNFIESFTTAARAGGVDLSASASFNPQSLLFIRLRQLVYNIYEFYKTKEKLRDSFFSKNIFEVITFIYNKIQNNELEADDEVQLIEYINNFDGLYTKRLTFELGRSNKTGINPLSSCFSTIYTILLSFGSMIEELHTLMVSVNQDAGDDVSTNKLLDDIWLHIQPRAIELPSWTGILYSTISYYDNCLAFSTLSYEQLLNLFLELSKTEIKCAIQDIDKGHDQSAEEVEKIGEKFTKAVKLGDPELALRPPPAHNHANNQKLFSKKLINTLHFCSVAISYDRIGNPILKVINSQRKDARNIYTGEDFMDDFMFDTDTYLPPPTTIVASISGIGSCENLGSIDYIKGKVPDLEQSKAALRNDFETYEAITKYFSKANIIELRFATTNFDAAAPSGCLYRNVGNQCLSYLPIRVGDKYYMYVILTTDLNHVKHQNSLELTSDTCVLSVTGVDIFEIDESDETLKNITLAISRDIPSKLEKPLLYKRKIEPMMKLLLEKCYKLPGNKLKKQMETICGRRIVDVVDGLDRARQASLNSPTNKAAEQRYTNGCIPAFEDIVDTIKTYYEKCKEEEKNSREQGRITNCVQNLTEFLTILYSCLFDKDLATTKSSIIPAVNPHTAAAAEGKGIDVGDPASILIGMKQGAYPTNLDDVSTSAPYLPYSQMSQLDDYDDEDDFENNKEQVLEIISENFMLTLPGKEPNSTTKNFSQIYDEAERYYSRRPGKQFPLSTKSIEEQAHHVARYIDQIYNIKNPDDFKAKYKGSMFSESKGGKRKTKKNKIYKNKINKRKTKKMNKKIRKTKKRQLRRKRITRRR
jgi:hypothetical protein